MIKSHIYSLFYSLLLFCVFVAPQSHATTKEEIVSEILQTVTTTYGGYVDEDIHKKYWNALTDGKELNSQEKRQIKKLLNDYYEKQETFLNMFFNSLSVTLKTGEAYFSPAYLNRKERFENEPNQSFRSKLQQFTKMADEAIEAVSKGESAVIPFEGLVEITPDKLKELHFAHKARQRRLSLLTKPVWEKNNKIWQLEEAGISVSWHLPFVLKIEKATTGWILRKSAVGHTYFSYLDLNHFVAASATSLPQKKELKVQDLRNSIKVARKLMGLKSGNGKDEEFFGQKSYVWEGNLELGGDKGFIVIRTLQNPDTSKLMQFFSMSAISLDEAKQLQTEFESSISFAK